jgi:hypothetical protein
MTPALRLASRSQGSPLFALSRLPPFSPNPLPPKHPRRSRSRIQLNRSTPIWRTHPTPSATWLCAGPSGVIISEQHTKCMPLFDSSPR